MIHRRDLIVAGFGLLCWPRAAAGAAQTGPVYPENFGARGDGRTDDTAALQRCIDSVPAGAVVRLRRGATYMVDTNADLTVGNMGGIKLRSNTIMELNGAELKALPSRRPGGAVVQGFRSRGWQLLGPGRITGERDRHVGTRGEWGMGVAALTSSGWRIGGDVEITNCWGDGILVGAAEPGTFCEDFLIEDVRVSNCRRNGISVVAGRNGIIRGASIRDINGVAPRGGIDLEPDKRAHPNRNIRISACRVAGDVGVGLYITVANEDIEVTGVDLLARNSGLLIHGIAERIRLTGSRIRSTRGGTEGAAIRAVGATGRFHDILIQENQLSGGGLFVVDFWGKGHRGLVVTENAIVADNAGTRGIVRMQEGTFTRNDCTIGAGAGRAGASFLHLQGATYGGNTYRNRSAYRMPGLYQGGRRIAPERYLSPTLIERSDAASS